MTREQILEAAAQIFSHKGYHGTSMQDIARAVALQKASLYHHVSGKQEILLELLDQGLDLLTARLLEIKEAGHPAGETLKKAMEAYLQTLAEHRDLAAVLLLEHRSLNPELQARHIPRRDEFEALWVDMLARGAAENEIVCKDPRLTAKALLGVMNWTITWFRPEGRLTPAGIADQFAHLLLKGLEPRQTGDGRP